MIVAAFQSEWVKLHRRTLLFGTYAATAVVAVLMTVLTFAQAGDGGGGGFGSRGSSVSLAELSASSGVVQGLTQAITFLGVVALSVAAAQLASDYTSGSLRNLLIRQPRRGVLLTGKYAAVVTFMFGLVLVAAVASTGAAFLMSGSRSISTGNWFSADGVGALLEGIANMGLAMVGYATLGTVLAVFFRSSVAAIVVGIAYLLPIETLVNAAIDGADSWLPGRLLDAIAHGGTSTVGYSTALLTIGLYLAAGLAICAVVFRRRDVRV